jgi:hypothetical protein
MGWRIWNGNIIIDYFSFKTLYWISDVSLVSACNAELCNNWRLYTFVVAGTLFLFLKKSITI